MVIRELFDAVFPALRQQSGGTFMTGSRFGDLEVSAAPTRIARIETFIVPPRWLMVRVETRDGAVGWGEASLEGHAEAVQGAFASLSERFVGADADNIEDIWQVAYRGGFYRGGPVLMSALSGLDQALWDLKGRRLGVPVWQLLGGRVRDRAPVYAWIGGDRPHEVVEAAKARIAQGFKAVKMNATGEIGWLDSTRTSTAACTSRWPSNWPPPWRRWSPCSSKSHCSRKTPKRSPSCRA
jgi:hypothetical protein